MKVMSFLMCGLLLALFAPPLLPIALALWFLLRSVRR